MPVYLASLAENLRRWLEVGKFFLANSLFLSDGVKVSVCGNDLLESLYGNVCAESHQSVIDIFHIVIVGNVESLLHDYSACVNVMIEEECCYASLLLAVYYCPVYRSCTTILRKQSCVNIESAEARH